MEKGKGKRIAVVGHFPFIPMVHGCLKKTLGYRENPQEGDFGEAKAENLIPLETYL
ncbi:MAG: hypothetical protein JRD71_01885 [Deltaproteobacteria bacterium]|nr:hypothetical protein [Deltaproteobacteria bacterium]